MRYGSELGEGEGGRGRREVRLVSLANRLFSETLLRSKPTLVFVGGLSILGGSVDFAGAVKGFATPKLGRGVCGPDLAVVPCTPTGLTCIFGEKEAFLRFPLPPALGTGTGFGPELGPGFETEFEIGFRPKLEMGIGIGTGTAFGSWLWFEGVVWVDLGCSISCPDFRTIISCCRILFFSCSSSYFCIHMLICFSKKFDFCISVSYLIVKQNKLQQTNQKIHCLSNRVLLLPQIEFFLGLCLLHRSFFLPVI
jgi:hypothetical protein